MDVTLREKCNEYIMPYQMSRDTLAKLNPLLEHLASCDPLELALLYTRHGGSITPFTLSEMKENLESIQSAHIQHAKDKIENILSWSDLSVLEFTWEVDLDIADIRQLTEDLVQCWQDTKKISDIYMESHLLVARVGYHEKLRDYVRAINQDVFYYSTMNEISPFLDDRNNWDIMRLSARLNTFDPFAHQDFDKDSCIRRMSMFICLYILYHCNNIFINAH